VSSLTTESFRDEGIPTKTKPSAEIKASPDVELTTSRIRSELEVSRGASLALESELIQQRQHINNKLHQLAQIREMEVEVLARYKRWVE
jgi:hypothetical protein